MANGVVDDAVQAVTGNEGASASDLTGGSTGIGSGKVGFGDDGQFHGGDLNTGGTGINTKGTSLHIDDDGNIQFKMPDTDQANTDVSGDGFFSTAFDALPGMGEGHALGMNGAQVMAATALGDSIFHTRLGGVDENGNWKHQTRAEKFQDRKPDTKGIPSDPVKASPAPHSPAPAAPGVPTPAAPSTLPPAGVIGGDAAPNLGAAGSVRGSVPEGFSKSFPDGSSYRDGVATGPGGDIKSSDHSRTSLPDGSVQDIRVNGDGSMDLRTTGPDGNEIQSAHKSPDGGEVRTTTHGDGSIQEDRYGKGGTPESSNLLKDDGTEVHHDYRPDGSSTSTTSGPDGTVQTEYNRNGSPTAQYEKDAAGNPALNTDFDENGRATQFSKFEDGNHVANSKVDAWDADGRPSQITHRDPATDAPLSRDNFNADGTREHHTPQGSDYFDDADRRTSHVDIDGEGKTTARTDFDYDKNGNVSRETHMSPDGDTLGSSEHTRDADGRITSTVDKDAAGEKVGSTDYTRDADGRVTEQVSKDANGDTTSRSQFDHDADGNVTKETHLNADGDEIGRTEFTRDADGNLEKAEKFDGAGDGATRTQATNYDGDRATKTDTFADDGKTVTSSTEHGTDGSKVTDFGGDSKTVTELDRDGDVTKATDIDSAGHETPHAQAQAAQRGPGEGNAWDRARNSAGSAYRDRDAQWKEGGKDRWYNQNKYLRDTAENRETARSAAQAAKKQELKAAGNLSKKEIKTAAKAAGEDAAKALGRGAVRKLPGVLARETAKTVGKAVAIRAAVMGALAAVPIVGWALDIGIALLSWAIDPEGRKLVNKGAELLGNLFGMDRRTPAIDDPPSGDKGSFFLPLVYSDGPAGQSHAALFGLQQDSRDVDILKQSNALRGINRELFGFDSYLVGPNKHREMTPIEMTSGGENIAAVANTVVPELVDVLEGINSTYNKYADEQYVGVSYERNQDVMRALNESPEQLATLTQNVMNALSASNDMYGAFYNSIMGAREEIADSSRGLIPLGGASVSLDAFDRSSQEMSEARKKISDAASAIGNIDMVSAQPPAIAEGNIASTASGGPKQDDEKEKDTPTPMPMPGTGGSLGNRDRNNDRTRDRDRDSERDGSRGKGNGNGGSKGGNLGDMLKGAGGATSPNGTTLGNGTPLGPDGKPISQAGTTSDPNSLSSMMNPNNPNSPLNKIRDSFSNSNPTKSGLQDPAKAAGLGDKTGSKATDKLKDLKDQVGKDTTKKTSLDPKTTKVGDKDKEKKGTPGAVPAEGEDKSDKKDIGKPEDQKGADGKPEDQKGPEGDTKDGGAGKPAAPGVVEDDKSKPVSPNGEVDPDNAADNPEGNTDPAAAGDDKKSDSPTELQRGNEKFDMKTPEATKMAELINPEGDEPARSIRDAMKEAGYTVPPAGEDIGAPVSITNIQPGDVVLGNGQEGVFVGDGKVLTSDGVQPLSDMAPFTGKDDGIFRPEGGTDPNADAGSGQTSADGVDTTGGASDPDSGNPLRSKDSGDNGPASPGNMGGPAAPRNTPASHKDKPQSDDPMSRILGKDGGEETKVVGTDSPNSTSNSSLKNIPTGN